ncbi:4-oxalocrotonate tautomerase [Mycobacterium sp. MS1601]|uniref:2-hydroxymuconate tautomerase n=1 Tax=Mycobacterium sp. MS1601 TaxID=1936029 RepID=UPI00097924B6|nr:2-hydroxymuconate tautomerase [Mycobacterium sp. MS1601]AQA03489.1 4-oxalocrotonate tautomerase [Mycobacterium sp. MS1601]
MPMVTVDWMAGRTPEQKREVAARITAAIAEAGGASADHVWVVFNDVAPDDWAIGGRMVSDR